MDTRDGQDSDQALKMNTLDLTIDPGLNGKRAIQRLDLLKKNLYIKEENAEKIIRALASSVEGYLSGRQSLASSIGQYGTITKVSRWPILIVRPVDDVSIESLKDQLSRAGFVCDSLLGKAYVQLGLLAIRTPPERCFIEALGKIPEVDRVERSWLKATLPSHGTPAIPGTSINQLIHPDKLLNRDNLPSELLSKRDPLRIGIIDSGIDATHAALKTRVMEQRAFRRGLNSIGDEYGHGTACAGIIARLCASAFFYSAKVFDESGVTNLDDIIRALGWLHRHKPDIILCNVVLPLPADGNSILTKLLVEFAKMQIPVILPTSDEFGNISAPADSPIFISVSPDSAPRDTPTTVRASGALTLCPRAIQAASDGPFVPMKNESWTALSGPATAAAVTTGCVSLMIRASRLSRHKPQLDIIESSLRDGHKNARLCLNDAIRSFISSLVSLQAKIPESDPEPFEAPTAVSFPIPQNLNPTLDGFEENAKTISLEISPSTLEDDKKLRRKRSSNKKTLHDMRLYSQKPPSDSSS